MRFGSSDFFKKLLAPRSQEVSPHNIFSIFAAISQRYSQILMLFPSTISRQKLIFILPRKVIGQSYCNKIVTKAAFLLLLSQRFQQSLSTYLITESNHFLEYVTRKVSKSGECFELQEVKTWKALFRSKILSYIVSRYYPRL